MIYKNNVNTSTNSTLKFSKNLQLKGLVEMLTNLFDEATWWISISFSFTFSLIVVTLLLGRVGGWHSHS
jgi:hypothetical protein